jgi:adenylate cyclase
MISAKSKRQLLQIIPFGLITMVFGIVYSLVEQGILGEHATYPSTSNPYFFNPISAGFLALISGLIIGSIEVILLNKRFQKNSFLEKIIYKTIIYMFLITAFTLLISMFSVAIELKSTPFDKRVLTNSYKFISSFAFLSIEIYISLPVIFSLFYTEVSDNIGQGVLINFFSGKYHQPIEEERVYMFLDMKSSTTFAEQLGHVRYFKMLKEYYVDLSDPIIQYGGEIYQYVGDEVIVTWKLKKDFANNSLNCFFAMKEALNSQAKKYQSEYGVIPTFKAGIHFGKVTTGEIGVIKKEITFSGDVLNTTARIQGLCNTYKVDLLISEKLGNAMEFNEAFKSKALGEAELRGRNERINLFTITMMASASPLKERL